MSNLTNTNLVDLIEETLSWADETAEMWAGTQYERIIDLQKDRLIVAAYGDYNLAAAKVLLYDLAQTLKGAEEAYE